MDRLECTVCGRPAESPRWRCDCGAPLDLPEVPAAALRDLPPSTARDPGLWRYRDCIPVAGDIAGKLSLGEGMTPLIVAGEQLAGVSIKLDYLFPTLSFKDRGAVVLVASAVQRGASALVADSSGNAGSAIAAYAARAGLPCTVFVPERTSAGKQRQIRAYGAAVRLVPGDRTATTLAAIDAVTATGAMYASHIYDPYFLQGTKTYAFELWEQLDTLPEALIVPVGNGTLLLGAARGFRELHAAGLIDREPALIAVQSERCPPLARAWANGATEPAPVEARDTVAEGIAIPRPPRGAQILAAVRASGGCIVEVAEDAVAPAQAELAGRGLFVEPTAALTWAAALLARELLADVATPGDGWARARELASDNVVVPLCGSGLKST
ncbi:MAG TPA: pyridoxal-phosphate dependent enzyme [Solirubrobacteraceae bacterium]|nr:pyridoxal-phosphate dependent enzyme [Solirubrobacteraceae bacterium]